MDGGVSIRIPQHMGSFAKGGETDTNGGEPQN